MEPEGRKAEAEQQYVTGSLTLRALAQETGISFSTLCRWSRAEKWPDKRRSFQRRALKKAVTRASDKRARELAAMTKASESMERALLRAANLFEVGLQAEENGSVFVNSKFAARNLESVAEAIGKITQNKMLLCGILEEKDKRRLELEERRQQSQETDGTEIIIDLQDAGAMSE